MEITFTTGISVITVVALFNGIATTMKLLRQRNGNSSIAEAVRGLREGQQAMCKTQDIMVEILRASSETQRAMSVIIADIKETQKDFSVCFQKLQTGAATREIYLNGILDELKAMNKDRR